MFPQTINSVELEHSLNIHTAAVKKRNKIFISQEMEKENGTSEKNQQQNNVKISISFNQQNERNFKRKCARLLSEYTTRRELRLMKFREFSFLYYIIVAAVLMEVEPLDFRKKILKINGKSWLISKLKEKLTIHWFSQVVDFISHLIL